MINTTTVDTSKKYGPSKYLTVGKFNVKINNVSTFISKTEKYQLRFELESKPIDDKDFVPVEGHTGQVGTVRTIYIATPEIEAQVGEMIAHLADELGVREQVNAIGNGKPEMTYPEWCVEFTNIVKDKFFWCTISGREYVNNNTGKIGKELSFSRFKSFASEAKVEELGLDKALAEPYLKKLPAQTETKSEEVIY